MVKAMKVEFSDDEPITGMTGNEFEDFKAELEAQREQLLIQVTSLQAELDQANETFVEAEMDSKVIISDVESLVQNLQGTIGELRATNAGLLEKISGSDADARIEQVDYARRQTDEAC